MCPGFLRSDMPITLTPPFGTYALPAANEGARQKASVYGDNRWGRLMISRARKQALKGVEEPFDVEVADGLKARLYPSGNRCEKRAFAGVQIWDAAERAALKNSIETAATSAFVFMDVGANVGLYSLFAAHYCQNANRDYQIIAIEPGLETCARLEANIAANGFDIRIIRAAISDAPGTGYLGGGENNRGEASLQDQSENTEPVIIDTLARICRVQGLSHINAMKLDIEGHDQIALKGFFEDAPERLHPDLLIVETGKDSDSPVIELCTAHDYMVRDRSGLNTILGKSTHV